MDRKARSIMTNHQRDDRHIRVSMLHHDVLRHDHGWDELTGRLSSPRCEVVDWPSRGRAPLARQHAVGTTRAADSLQQRPLQLVTRVGDASNEGRRGNLDEHQP